METYLVSVDLGIERQSHASRVGKHVLDIGREVDALLNLHLAILGAGGALERVRAFNVRQVEESRHRENLVLEELRFSRGRRWYYMCSQVQSSSYMIVCNAG